MYGKPYSNQRKKILQQVTWDSNKNIADLESLLQGKRHDLNGLTRQRLLQRIAESLSWYAILNTLTLPELKDMLHQEVVSGLRSGALIQQYTHVQKKLRHLI